MSVGICETRSGRSGEAISARSGRPRILIVDDNDLVRRSLQVKLSNLGYGVMTVAAPDDALGALETGAFDVLLADYAPGAKTTGLMLACVVRRLWPATKLILMTGYEPSQLPCASALESFPLLRKPVASDDFARVLENLEAAA